MADDPMLIGTDDLQNDWSGGPRSWDEPRPRVVVHNHVKRNMTIKVTLKDLVIFGVLAWFFGIIA